MLCCRSDRATERGLERLLLGYLVYIVVQRGGSSSIADSVSISGEDELLEEVRSGMLQVGAKSMLGHASVWTLAGFA